MSRILSAERIALVRIIQALVFEEDMERIEHNNWAWEAFERILADRDVGRLTGEITEASIADRLYEADIPDPDLIIRTSGEQRLSNFLLWQAAYSELVFLDANWPDFTRESMEAALAEYHRRDRRYGGTRG